MRICAWTASFYGEIYHFFSILLLSTCLPAGGGHAAPAQPCCATCTGYDPVRMPTALLRDTAHRMSTGLTQHLARKASKQGSVSYSLPNTNNSLALLVENRIKGEMAAFPGKF
uniref:Uncharacterized protein n=1 Tax=Bos mutus grunniens TaxID=30521 RepID=A0A8C0AHB5_BOSMU